MNMLQRNNFSARGQGQPTQGKQHSRPNFMNQTMGMEDPDQGPPMQEAVAPGIPAAQMGGSLQAPPQRPAQPNGHPQSGPFLGPPTNNTLPIPGLPRSPMPPIPQGNLPHTQPPVPRTPSVPYHPTTNSAPGSYGGQIYTGFNPLQRMEGFDFSREQNTGKSAKDAFAFLSNQAAQKGKLAPLNATGPEGKAAYGQWFNDNILSGMNDLGHKVDWVDGDKFGFSNWQGKFNVDYGRGAGGADGALAWQADDANAQNLPRSAPANDLYNQFQQQLQPPSTDSDDQLQQLLQMLMSQGQEQEQY